MEVFYLKINRNRFYSIKYVEMWVDMVKQLNDPIVYILVDNENIQKQIIEVVDFQNVSHEFLKSRFDSEELQSVAGNFAGRFTRVGCAMLTPFAHSRDMGYEDFWNIDADDIGVYASPHRWKQIVSEVRKCAIDNGLNILSMDAAQSLHAQRPPIPAWPELIRDWSFGVAYVRNNIDWIKILQKHCSDKEFSRSRLYTSNLDRYVGSYLHKKGIVKVGTFYVENLHAVINHHEDMYFCPVCGMRYWHNDRIYFSIMVHDFGLGESGSIPINQMDMTKIDIGLTIEEEHRRLQEVALKYKYYMTFLVKEKILLANFVDKINDIIPPPPHNQMFLCTVFFEACREMLVCFKRMVKCRI